MKYKIIDKDFSAKTMKTLNTIFDKIENGRLEPWEKDLLEYEAHCIQQIEMPA